MRRLNSLAGATASARRRARDLRERQDPEPARLLEEATEFAGDIAGHLAGIIDRLAEEAAAGRPLEEHVRAFRAAADTVVAAAKPAPAESDVLPLRRGSASRVRALSAVLVAFDLADAGYSRDDVVEYLRARYRDLDDGVLKAVAELAAAT